ncbi:hypothetical protein [Streptomyces yangpuensis]|uniref:hypothetical protein n=1 Tax=Streptomyces yangpuensis TaxID=1648182 RepID=UPI0036468B28
MGKSRFAEEKLSGGPCPIRCQGKPGRQHVIAVQSGSTAGTEAWAWYAEPADRGLVGEREHW